MGILIIKRILGSPGEQRRLTLEAPGKALQKSFLCFGGFRVQCVKIIDISKQMINFNSSTYRGNNTSSKIHHSSSSSSSSSRRPPP